MNTVKIIPGSDKQMQFFRLTFSEKIILLGHEK